MNQFSDEQLKDKLEKTLKQNNYSKEIWVFAYGALMWAPCFEPEVTLSSTLKGWARKPCLWTLTARGSKQKPGAPASLALPAEAATQSIKALARRSRAHAAATTHQSSRLDHASTSERPPLVARALGRTTQE